jgi:hypothetical protein
VVSFKSPADTPAMPGMLRKSTAFVPRYQKFESISLQRRVHCELVAKASSQAGRLPLGLEGGLYETGTFGEAVN